MVEFRQNGRISPNSGHTGSYWILFFYRATESADGGTLWRGGRRGLATRDQYYKTFFAQTDDGKIVKQLIECTNIWKVELDEL